jgi:hypothetical protein
VNRLRVLCKDGGSVWLEGRSRLGPNGEMIGTLHDVSPQVSRATHLAPGKCWPKRPASASGATSR